MAWETITSIAVLAKKNEEKRQSKVAQAPDVELDEETGEVIETTQPAQVVTPEPAVKKRGRPAAKGKTKPKGN